MGKALLVQAQNSTAAMVSGDELNLFGSGGRNATEANAQVSCTEGASFTGLGARITAGGSGTNNFRFRDAGADGQQLASRAGTGVCEDTTNTDTLTAGDLFNIAYTDTGTNSTVSWVKMNVEMASGHGNFHGSMNQNGAVFDVASSTRYIGMSGSLFSDGQATEAFVGLKMRGYTSQAALQVRVTANARTNASVFKNRINAANGGATITFNGSGDLGGTETGFKEVVGLTDAIADGDTVNASVTLLTGVEDLTVSFVIGTYKSTSNKSEIWSSHDAGLARTASATADYHPIGGRLFVDTDANNRIKPGFAGIASNLRCYLSANTYGGNGTLKLMQNGSAVITTTITASGGAAWYENTSDTVTFDDNDEFSFEIDEGTSGSITIHTIGMTFAPPATGTIAPRALNHFHKMMNA